MYGLTNNKFFGERSKQYKKAIGSFDGVWAEDTEIMLSYLKPQEGDIILEVGAGSGFFSFDIAKCVGNSGHVYIADPSAEQLQPVIANKQNNMTVLKQSAENTCVDEKVDKIWSRGSFHHVFDKTTAFKCFYNASKSKAKLVIFDIFSHSKTANFFDSFVSRSCITGHDVAFFSKEFATSLSIISGWGQPKYIDIPLRWKFSKERDIGVFLATLLAGKNEYKIEDYMQAAYDFLGYFKLKKHYYLNWPMTMMLCCKV